MIIHEFGFTVDASHILVFVFYREADSLANDLDMHPYQLSRNPYELYTLYLP